MPFKFLNIKIQITFLKTTMKSYFLVVSFIFSVLFSLSSVATEKTVIRLGVLASGTLEWEINALKHEKWLDNADFDIQTHLLANPQAAEVALQGGAVDMIVSDWIWTAKMRASGTDLTFYPYSTTAGALVVPTKSTIKSLKDLQGKRLGIAGGELDKNWLLLQALAQQQHLDLKTITPVFGAPPLLNEQLKENRVDAVLTYWHFAARLEPQGYRKILDGKTLLSDLGIKEDVPSLGYVFKQSWATEHKAVLDHFFAATQHAKDKLCESTKTDNTLWHAATQLSPHDEASPLRERYCAGRITQWSVNEQKAAERIYSILRKLSNNKLTGSTETLPTGLFWSPK
jgi:NitT/TauT family transport system substrate-binding protein